jgi:hypothetical protein
VLALLCLRQSLWRSSDRWSPKILKPSAPAGCWWKPGSIMETTSSFPHLASRANLWRVPLVGAQRRVSSIAEIQIDGGFYNHLSITERDLAAPLAGMVTATGDSTSDVQDFSIGAKSV